MTPLPHLPPPHGLLPPPNPPPPDWDQRIMRWLLVAATLGFAWILLPFFGPLMWGAIIALLFAPVNAWWLRRWPGHRNLAALLTLAGVLVMVILPFLAILASLAAETAAVYAQLQSGALDPQRYFAQAVAALPEWVTARLNQFGLVDFAALQRRATTGLNQASQFLAAQVFSIGQNTFEFVTSLFITVYLAFFLIRDGQALSRRLQVAVPLAPAHQAELRDKFTTVVRATVKGNLLVAAIQGALGGLAFWTLDVSGALLWAALMAFLSLLPAIGAALVWVPVAVYFLLVGAVWQGLALAAWGLLVIGLVDNLLRPLLVGRDTRMPDALVLISTLGGMAVFGLNGFVLGPVLAAMFMAVWQIHLRVATDAAEGTR